MMIFSKKVNDSITISVNEIRINILKIYHNGAKLSIGRGTPFFLNTDESIKLNSDLSSLILIATRKDRVWIGIENNENVTRIKRTRCMLRIFDEP